MFSLNDKVVVVTGGARGIGLGIAKSMLDAGARVLITSRSADAGDHARLLLASGGGDVALHVGDITSDAGVEAVVAKALQCFGRIDSWVANAGGVERGDSGTLMKVTSDSWDRIIDLNLKWAFFGARAAAKVMAPGSSIINISSRSGAHPSPLAGVYGAAKAGLDALTATMALEWGHLGIRINGIAPGVVLSESMAALLDNDARERQIGTIPLRRLGMPEDIGHLAVYLASDEAAWLTGTTVQINGGSRIPVATLNYLEAIDRRMSVRRDR